LPFHVFTQEFTYEAACLFGSGSPIVNDASYIFLPIEDIPPDAGWLDRQICPVVAIGEGMPDNADVVVADERELSLLQSTLEHSPIAAMALIQVLRIVGNLPVEQAMTVESLAYATLQGGPEYHAWLAGREEEAQFVQGGEGEPVVLWREGDIVYAELNRPENRNSLTVEMRDALVELFDLVITDSSIRRLQLSGRGSCFSVGGELREFGLSTDVATAHWVRSTHNPGRLLARCADRVHCHIHSACIGSGMEIPAFASHVSAQPRTFFQLPELSMGLIPGAGGCVSVSRRIGRHRTAWLALTAKKINVQTALDWGLVDEISSQPGHTS